MIRIKKVVVIETGEIRIKIKIVIQYLIMNIIKMIIKIKHFGLIKIINMINLFLIMITQLRPHLIKIKTLILVKINIKDFFQPKKISQKKLMIIQVKKIFNMKITKEVIF